MKLPDEAVVEQYLRRNGQIDGQDTIERLTMEKDARQEKETNI